ncbi:MAG TPA: putative peptidoglycan glycosyltransferase FtsW [Patescibacteria group bacterium]|nr:putative peptidoglycan glycosyltransferase FtsW [Patescibacteria group bacterium]
MWQDGGRRRQPSILGSQGVGNRRKHRPDYKLLIVSATLIAIGLMVVYAISPALAAQKHVSDNYYVGKQVIAILLGVIAFFVMATTPLNTWRHLQKLLIIGAIVVTAMALMMPTSIEYPAHRWIRFGGLSLQSVEFIKFALLICLASFLADRAKQNNIHDDKKTMQPVLIAMATIGFIVGIAQKDFGSTAVLVAMIVAMSFVAGLPLRRIVLTGLVTVAALTLLILPFSYRRDRVLNFLHPEQNCLTSGYQACQALIAVGSGGIFGKGFANSVQAYGYVPEAANDSIFAIYAEKFGFLGVTILLVLFMALFSRLKNIMERAPDNFSRLIVAGVLAWLSTQSIINIGAMLGLLPLKGITLPFVSYGGTSVLFVTGAIGLMFNVSRYTTYIARSEGASGRDSNVPRQNYRISRPNEV